MRGINVREREGRRRRDAGGGARGKRSAAATWESFLVFSDHELDRHVVQQMNHGLSKHEEQICLAQDCLQIVFLLHLFIQNIAKFCSLTRNYFSQYSLVNIYSLSIHPFPATPSPSVSNSELD